MIAGVDGCKGGWLVAMADGWPCPNQPVIVFCESFSEVLTASQNCTVVAVDVPIGLPTAEQWPRACDLIARDELGTAWQRVFLAPPREAIRSVEDYAAFSDHHFRLTGCRPTTQAWGFAKKSIRDVDQALWSLPSPQDRIVESHPELAWKALAGKVLPSKHTARGLLERLNFLQHPEHRVPGLLDMRIAPATAKGALDDLLDALVLISVAAHVQEVGIDVTPAAARRHPNKPIGEIPTDGGLRMEIWY